jgi:hypothetical protein
MVGAQGALLPDRAPIDGKSRGQSLDAGRKALETRDFAASRQALLTAGV